MATKHTRVAPIWDSNTSTKISQRRMWWLMVVHVLLRYLNGNVSLKLIFGRSCIIQTGWKWANLAWKLIYLKEIYHEADLHTRNTIGTWLVLLMDLDNGIVNKNWKWTRRLKKNEETLANSLHNVFNYRRALLFWHEIVIST